MGLQILVRDDLIYDVPCRHTVGRHQLARAPPLLERNVRHFDAFGRPISGQDPCAALLISLAIYEVRA
jgi:hypothetical protein